VSFRSIITIALAPLLALPAGAVERSKSARSSVQLDTSTVILSLAAAFALAYIASLVWVFRDARRRGKSGLLVLLLAWWWWPVSLLVWLALRPHPPNPPPSINRNFDDFRLQ
jgi:hypothetical protein